MVGRLSWKAGSMNLVFQVSKQITFFMDNILALLKDGQSGLNKRNEAFSFHSMATKVYEEVLLMVIIKFRK